jgi:sec-independent protein translocase protein TatB
MFDIGWSEFVVIGVVALIVIGPKELPAVLRTIGQWTTKIRRMAGEFQSQFQEAMREAEMADLKKSVEELSDSTKGITADPFDFSESTKWEPKTDTAAAASEATPAEAAAATGASAATDAPDATDASAGIDAPAATDAAVAPVAVAGDAPAAASAAPDSGASAVPAAVEPMAEGGGRA